MIPKFRGVSISDNNKGQWMYGNLIIDGDYAYIVNGVIESNDQYITIAEWCPVAPITIGASTGLFDVNGKEIFEGDVLTYLDDDNIPIYENAVVKIGQHTNVDTIFERKPVYIGVYVEVQKGTATFDVVRMYNDYEGRLTIIGNIYENPELVEME
ncbi:TPA: hypothetical protein U0910_000792 [Streptococcus suis 8830]|uniref:YopX family protein n=1 Tax=Streptococcus suis TaxID=1307 RepID=UPI000408909E|nr:YopX family protein [Streptococcus suis]HEM3202776.1 hypothetical protein [Streptococcus suis 8830]